MPLAGALSAVRPITVPAGGMNMNNDIRELTGDELEVVDGFCEFYLNEAANLTNGVTANNNRPQRKMLPQWMHIFAANRTGRLS